MICVENLSKIYGDFKALDRVSFNIKKGSLVGLLGPNGAGKTTLMDILAGVSFFQEGRVTIADRNVEESSELKEKIGYLPDNPPLYLDMTVAGYLEYVAFLKKIPQAQISRRVDRFLTELDIGNCRDRIIGHLSKGYRQRVGLAQALINEPELLILDEPTVALDPKQRALVKKLVKSLKGRQTILFSTHILSDVEDICDDVILISDGKLKTSGSLSSLSCGKDEGGVFEFGLQSNVNKQELFLIEEVKSVHQREGSKWEVILSASDVPVTEVTDRYLSILAQKGWGVSEFSSVSNNLQSLFFQDIEGRDDS